MLRSGSPLSKAAGGLAIIFALLSAVFVIAQQCHASQTSSAVVSTHHHDGTHLLSGGSVHATESVPMNSSLVRGLCAGFFFVVLILGRKFLLRFFDNTWPSRQENLWSRSDLSPPMSRLRAALTLPQLGICRI